MTLAFSWTVANARLDAIETAIGTAPILRIYSGTIPANCLVAIGAQTTLVELTLANDWMTNAAYGFKAKNTEGPAAAASASGTASFFRLYDSAGTTCHMQGSVSAAGGGGDLILTSTSIAQGQLVGINTMWWRASGVKAFEGGVTATLAALSLSGAGAVADVSWNSIRFNQTQYTNQWVYRSASAPSTGVLLTMWIKVPTAISSYPTTRPNQEFCRINFGNWYTRWITMNGTTNDANSGVSQSNSMLLCDGTAVSESQDSWAGDFTFWEDTGLPVARLNGWVFCAVQASIDGSSNITLRQWLRYAGQTISSVHSSTISLSTLRSDLQSNAGWTLAHANSYTPSTTISSIQINGGDGSDLYITSARVADTATEPSGTDLTNISNLTSADSTAWADWSLRWESGAATLTDRSGNSRGLTGMGGTLSQGGAFP